MIRRASIPVVLLFSLLCLTTAAAQTFLGGVRGSVIAQGGDVVTATVRLVDEETGLERSTATNAEGAYAFPDVLPGTYRISATAPGYSSRPRDGVRIATQTFVTLDIGLYIAVDAEPLTVRSRVSDLDTSAGSLSALLDRSTLQTLPSAGRNVFVMASMTPTVIATGDSQFVRQQDQSNSSLISIAGGPRRDNTYVVDGVPIVDILNRASFIPSLQAVEEMRLQVSAYDAVVGRTSGGVFNVTGRTGTNAWRGSAMYQDRPQLAQGRLFFAEKNDIETPDGYYHLYGGSFGGPIRRNHTFFFASTEGYRSATTRAAVLTMPTDAERRGDFSQSGVTIFDPSTTRPDPVAPGQFIRDPFPNNRIPESRLNPVAVAMLRYAPMPANGRSLPAIATIVDAADQATGKITHQWHPTLMTSGLYAWYGSAEPDARFYGRPLGENGADPGDGALYRRVHLAALNTMWTAGLTLVDVRYGFNQFLDDNRPAPFDPGSLGFAPGFVNAVPLKKFPGIGVADYGRFSTLFGDRTQDRSTYYSHTAGATLSRLVGRHTVRSGGELRLNGVRFHSIGGSGAFTFTRDFTLGPNPIAPAPNTGNAFAGFLLGYPASGSISVGTPIDVYLTYWSGFAQDEIRLTPRLTVAAGLRYEFEQGLRERHDRMTVGWDFDRGGLIFAGRNGAPTHQGRPNPRQFAPRAAFAYAVNDRTIVRGGYGLFYAPPQGISNSENGSGTPGYNRTTNYVATLGNPFIPCPTCSMTNPFPNGIDQPAPPDSTLGIGGYTSFVDPEARQGHLHRASIDIQHEFAGGVVASAGYLAAHGGNLAGGMSGAPRNINQLDPKYLSLGAALQEQVANPYFGTPLGVGILAGPTVPRGQLLRQYPQYDTVDMIRSSLSRSRYDAIVLAAARRLRNHWTARANYTWSRAKDSQFSESNFFAGGSAIQNVFDVEREYALSVLDTPHRLNVNAVLEARGWAFSVAGSYQSGFPLTVVQALQNTGLLGGTQRPNIATGTRAQLTDDPTGSYDAVCSCIRWLNPAAWSQAAPFTFGNAPRTDARVRTPARKNWDVAVEKSHRMAATTLALRAELINIFNFADLRGPSIAFGDASFGQIREAAGFPRLLQLSLRASW